MRWLLRALALLLALLPSAASLVPATASAKAYIFQVGVSGAPWCTWVGSDTTVISSKAVWKDTAIRYIVTWAQTRNFGAEDSMMFSPIGADSGEAMVMIDVDFESYISATEKITRARLGFYDIAAEAEAAGPTLDDKLARVYRCAEAWEEGTGNGVSQGVASATGQNGATGNHARSGVAWPGNVADSQNAIADFWRSGTGTTPDTSSTGASGWWGVDSLGGPDANWASNIPSQPEAEFYLRTRVSPPGGQVYEKLGRNVIDITRYIDMAHRGDIANNGIAFTNSTSALKKRTFFASSEHATISKRPWLVIETEEAGAGAAAAVQRGGIGGSGNIGARP